MTGGHKQSDDLAALRRRLAATEEQLATVDQTLRAVLDGEPEAIVIPRPDGQIVYTRSGESNSYKTLVERMCQGAVILDQDGVVLYANQRLAETLETPLNEVIGSPLSRFTEGERESARLSGLIRAASQSPRENEICLTARSGVAVPALVSLNRLPLGDGEDTVCGVVTDLRDQLRRQAIVESEQLARLILDQAAEAIVVLDADGTITRASQAAAVLAGRDVLDAPFNEMFRLSLESTEDGRTGRRVDQKGLLARARQHKKQRGLQVHMARDDGQEFSLVLSLAPLWSSEQRFSGAVLTLTDVTARNREHRALLQAQSARGLATGLLKGQEEERRRVARELHDGLSQELVIAAVEAGAMRDDAPEAAQGRFTRLEKRIADLAEHVRRISHGLHPAVLEHVGLAAALGGIAQDARSRSALKVEVRADETLDVAPAVATALYRIAQEALRNAERHSGATTVTISLRRDETHLLLSIVDDGSGFEVGAQGAGQGLGLASIRERASIVGGDFEVASEPGAGAALRIRVPLRLIADTENVGKPH